MLAPKEWTAIATTLGGLTLNIRSVSPADTSDLLTFLKAVEPTDLRFRFLSAVKPSEALARILADVDHKSSEDLVAFDTRDGRIAATAMIAASDEPGSAEVAVLVRSDLKGLGLGWEMLRQACAYARSVGYRKAESVEWSSNERAISLEREQGFRSHLYAGDPRLTLLTKELA